MKKFLKSKAHLDALAYAESIESHPECNPEISAEIDPVTFNPPLPLDPPPPESPPAPPSPEYDDSNMLSQEILQNIKKEAPDEVKFEEDKDDGDKSKEICRDFIRGKCNRPGHCRHLHKFDPKQLRGIYTFCHNYQNNICSYPNCKFVHASIFEEAEFYRTGTLPARVFEHQTQSQTQQEKPKLLPPPPPPPDNAEEPQPLPINNTAAEQPTLQGLAIDMALRSPGQPNAAPAPFQARNFWPEPGTTNSIAPTAKPTCESCDIYLNREQHTKSRAEQISKSVHDYDEKIEALKLKVKRLDEVLHVLLNSNM